MRVTNCLLVSGLAVLSSCASFVEGWGEDLPWFDLKEQLSPVSFLVDTGPSDYLGECTSELDRNLFAGDRTMHAMIDQPSGLCMAHFFCAFDRCYPNPEPVATVQRLGEVLVASVSNYSDLDPQIRAWTDDLENPSYNLPSKVLFPVVASDVVAAVNFAKEHGLEISVKNSGHNYVGASTKKDTLHLNMNRYTHYTPTSIIDCDPDTTIDPETLAGQPCALSLAKNKNAVIRIGGGENWDKTYGAVKVANEAQEGGIFKYHVVGGAAATVSPMGWTYQGGLSGTTAGRIHGFGVDQVIQLEMVLPNGQHVKFGPSEWEDIPNAVPKTTKVSGVCRTNPLELDEEKWDWAECPADLNLNFDDLWFAARGGGGGTWGVVTSQYYQLHPYLPLERIGMVPYPQDFPVVLDETQLQLLSKEYQKFEILFLLDPESIGATPEESNACGWAASDFEFSCYGEGSAGVFDATWRRYLDASIRDTLLEGGIPEDFIDASVNCTECSLVTKWQDYPSLRSYPEGHRFYGRASDDSVYIGSTAETLANVIIPKAWILQNVDLAATLFPPNPVSYRAFGGRTSGAVSDQANSLSQAHREGGYMYYFSIFDYPGNPTGLIYDDTFFTDILPALYDTSGENFPGYIGSNHAGPNTMGPLKDDWTKACPIEWTEAERNEKCIPLQEAIYGSEVLARLEAIKEAIDPDYMFDCYKCIGNNRAKPDPVVEEPSHDEGEDHDSNDHGDGEHDSHDSHDSHDGHKDGEHASGDDHDSELSEDPEDSGAFGMVQTSTYAMLVLIGSLLFV